MSEHEIDPSVSETAKTPLLQRPWARLWILSEVLTILAIIGFFAWPRDTSVRAADNIDTGSVEEFATTMTDVQNIDSTIRVDLRYRNADNVTGAPLPGYEGNHAFLRREAAIALALVNRDLSADGLGLLVYDSYRPVRASQAMMGFAKRGPSDQPVTDGELAERDVHSFGVAIDCTIVDLTTGQSLDMGTPFGTRVDAAQTATATSGGATNRANFIAAMKRRGFTHFDEQWWHFTYAVPDSTLRRFDVPIR